MPLETPMPRIQVFNCPSCGARLTVEGDEAGDQVFKFVLKGP
jgi:hypothetical protein